MKRHTTAPRHDLSIRTTVLLIAAAYIFAIAVRMYWPYYFSDQASMIYNGTLMINTNDGYFFASGAKDILEGVVPQDAQRLSALKYGLTHVTAFLTKTLPFSLEQIILYLSAFVSSLLVIPIVLSARLMGHTMLGFFAALIGSIAWSYYNRTMVGYYDSDMFSVFLQFSIFYGLLYIAYRKSFAGIIITSLLILIYPYFYPQGVSITYAMFLILVVYLSAEYFGWIKATETVPFSERNDLFYYQSIAILSIMLMTTLPAWLRVALAAVAYVALSHAKLEKKHYLAVTAAILVGFMYFGNFFHVLTYKLFSYLDRGVEESGLHFFQVIQTVREAGAIPMSTIANRISGSSWGLLFSVVGFVWLVMRHKPFVIALPLIGVGFFAYVGGLRFTVYAVPVAALSAVYLFWSIGMFFANKNKKAPYIVAAVGTLLMLYPNIAHVLEYKVPTVLNKAEVDDLQKLKTIAKRGDYTIAWWDYGYPIWFYANTSTLIDGGKHHKDNFIVSTILQTDSPQLAANLARLAVETYVDTNYTVVSDTIFQLHQDPNLLLEELAVGERPLPSKTREIYLYLPYRMINIFPTVMLFGNIDLATGKTKHKTAFYPTRAIENKSGVILFANGAQFDIKRGMFYWNNIQTPVKYLVTVRTRKNGETHTQTQFIRMDGTYVIVHLQSYGIFVIMDEKTFQSVYVQMFLLGKYDPSLFELVVNSPYSKIYRIKI